MFQNIILIGTGGFLGSVLRYGSNQMIQKIFETTHPIGTFSVNIIGSFLIGIILGLFQRGDLLSTNWKLFLAVGFCGGFTTFSSFAFENLELLQANQFFISIMYVVLSLVIGFLAVFLGFHIVK